MRVWKKEKGLQDSNCQLEDLFFGGQFMPGASGPVRFVYTFLGGKSKAIA